MAVKKEVSKKISVNEDVKPEWYVFRVQSKKEETMIKLLRASFVILAKDGIRGEDYFLDFSIPKYHFVEYKNGKKIEKDLNAYPGYIFMKIKLTDSISVFLRNFFKNNGFGQILPRPITEQEYKAMMDKVNGLNDNKTVQFHIGMRIKINGGSFATMEGNILSIDEANKKLVVSVMILGVETKIDINFEQASIVTGK